IAGAIFDKHYIAPRFDWGKALPELIDAIRARARAKGDAGGIIYGFPDCASGIRYGAGSQEIDAWEMSVLLAEYAAGMLAQKAAEGHCPKEAPCSKSSKEHLQMLEDFKLCVQELVRQVDDLSGKIKGLKTLGPEAAKALGLRD